MYTKFKTSSSEDVHKYYTGEIFVEHCLKKYDFITTERILINEMIFQLAYSDCGASGCGFYSISEQIFVQVILIKIRDFQSALFQKCVTVK